MSNDNETVIRDALISGNYRDPERTKQDVLEVITQYPGLQPVADSYMYNDGTVQLLLKLTGTLPVQYKGNTYYIPIDMWLLNTYPYNAPMIFVCPTYGTGMMIRPSENVMADGKVKLPYLQEWKHNSSELLLLIQVLIIQFEETPPVYSEQFSPPPLQSPPYPVLSNTNHSFPIPYVDAISNGLSSERLDLLQNAAGLLFRRLQVTYQSTVFEKWNQSQLEAGSKRLENMTETLQGEINSLEVRINNTESEIEQLSAKIVSCEADLEDRGTNIEDAVVAPRPLYRQIVETNAEESAYQDAMYYVNEGFRCGRMELDQFEKNIRKLARKQFMLRLLLTKCRERAGLRH